MRELFPKNNSTNILGKDSDIVKKEDLLPIVEQLQTTIQQLNNLSTALSQYETDNTQVINTTQLNAVNAAITVLEATASNLASSEVDNLTVSSLATITTLVAQIANISSSLSVPEIQTNELTALEVSVSSGEFMELKASTASIENWNISNFTIEDLTVTQDITSTGITSTTGNISNITSDNITVSEDASIGGDLTVGDIESDSIIADEVATENIHWIGSIALSDLETFYIKIPHFENGQYYIRLLEGSYTFATMEVFNSIDNFFVRWSQGVNNRFTHIYKYGEGPNTELYIKVSNSTGNALTLEYATICATPNVQGPATYTELPIDDYLDYEVGYKDGSKFFKNIDLATQGTSIGVLNVSTSTDASEATSDASYDTTSNINVVIYKPNQSVNKTDDVEFNSVTTETLEGARKIATRNFVATELETLSTIDLTDYDDGSVIVVRDNSTAETNAPSSAYIKKTENTVPVLYKIIIGKSLSTSGNNSNKPLIWSVADQAIMEATNIAISGTIDVSGNATFGGNIVATGDISANDATLSGDAIITGDISATDITGSGNLSLTGNATIGGTTTITGDAVVHGDLYVDGTTHTTTEESISTTGDTITLRQNNSTSLGNNYSGFIVNKYDGTHDLALVTDSDGTLRVGTGSGTETTYVNIYWDDDTEKWYSDSVLTTEVSPSGNLSSWSSLTIDGSVKHYTNAIFTAITYASLVPILGRDEDTNLTNGALLYWDGTNWIAKTITNPSNKQILLGNNGSYEWVGTPSGSTQVLVGNNNNNSISYSWSDMPRNFVFANMAAYQAAASTVPDGSLVIIENENDYLIGENQ